MAPGGSSDLQSLFILLCLKTAIANRFLVLFCLKTAIANRFLVFFCLKTAIANRGTPWCIVELDDVLIRLRAGSLAGY